MVFIFTSGRKNYSKKKWTGFHLAPDNYFCKKNPVPEAPESIGEKKQILELQPY